MLILSNSIRPGDPDNVAGIPILRTASKKPFNEGEVRRAMEGLSGERVWLVGDRLMTDIYLANKVGIRSALVPPIEETSVGKHGVVVWVLRGV
jgi:predicted HAD superfamily phosphohydrolase YqeG